LQPTFRSGGAQRSERTTQPPLALETGFFLLLLTVGGCCSTDDTEEVAGMAATYLSGHDDPNLPMATSRLPPATPQWCTLTPTGGPTLIPGERTREEQVLMSQSSSVSTVRSIEWPCVVG
jgi:hypothetical protein